MAPLPQLLAFTVTRLEIAEGGRRPDCHACVVWSYVVVPLPEVEMRGADHAPGTISSWRVLAKGRTRYHLFVPEATASVKVVAAPAKTVDAVEKSPFVVICNSYPSAPGTDSHESALPLEFAVARRFHGVRGGTGRTAIGLRTGRSCARWARATEGMGMGIL
jgi:hypothetical protein